VIFALPLPQEARQMIAGGRNVTEAAAVNRVGAMAAHPFSYSTTLGFLDEPQLHHPRRHVWSPRLL
jgi:hypothetical protein